MRERIRYGLPRLGDAVKKALEGVGVTTERVSRWLGRPCDCEERRLKLNALSEWANWKLGLPAGLQAMEGGNHADEALNLLLNDEALDTGD